MAILILSTDYVIPSSVLLERKKAPQKENKHRAMDDIKESIAELKFYKEHIFKQRSRK